MPTNRFVRGTLIKAVCALVLGVLALSGGSRAEAQPVSKSLAYKVKAAYLFNFTKYTDWPARAFPQADSPIMIGILGTDPFGDLLEQTIGSRLVGDRRVRVHRSQRVEDLRQCHVLFIGDSEKDKWPAVLADLKGTFALTVSEIPQFCLHNGMITFVIENGVVRFDVNLDAAEEAGLKISARMLNTAKTVYSRNRNH